MFTILSPVSVWLPVDKQHHVQFTVNITHSYNHGRGKAVPVRTMKAYRGEWRYRVALDGDEFLTSRPPQTLYPKERASSYNWIGDRVGPRAGWAFWWGQNLFTCWELSPRSSNLWPTHYTHWAILTYASKMNDQLHRAESWLRSWYFSASQEIPRILWNPIVHYHIHKCPPLVPNMSQTIAVHTLPSSWRFIPILSSYLCQGLPSGLLPYCFPTKTLFYFVCATCPNHHPNIWCVQ